MTEREIHIAEKRLEIANTIINAASAVNNDIKAYADALPTKRKGVFRKIWYYFADRRQRRKAGIHIAKASISSAMSAVQIMVIQAKPIQKDKNDEK